MRPDRNSEPPPSVPAPAPAESAGPCAADTEITGCDGSNATAPAPAIAPGRDAYSTAHAAEFAATRYGGPLIDPRISALVPGFDAPFFQAGLAGYSDAAMRLIARQHGCPFCVTESLLDRTLLAGGRGFAKADLGELHDNVPGGADDHPLAGQIMGSDPREMAAAALKMIEQRARGDSTYRALAYTDGQLPKTHLRLPGGEQLRPDAAPPLPAAFAERPLAPAPHSPTASLPGRSFEVVDVNLACPVKKIKSKARGGHWLTDPAGAIAILEAVRAAVPADIPCTVKLRRAFDDTPEMAANFEKIFAAAYRIGYAWTTVHARTVVQKYVGPSRWTFLRDLVAQHPEKIIFGSGDVWDVHDITGMIRYTGVHAVSVARGCIGNPWIFRQARDLLAGRPPRPPTVSEQRRVLDAHYQLLLRVNAGARDADDLSSRQIRKFGVRFSTHHPQCEEVRQRVIAVRSEADWLRVLADHYPG